MKRTLSAFLLLLGVITICDAAGAHAGDVFNEDVIITDAVIPQGEYERAVIRGNLTINCTVIGQQAFKDAIIVGDVTIEANIVSPEAFKDAVIGGKRTINDDATVDATAFDVRSEFDIIRGDVILSKCLAVHPAAYRDKVIIGNVTIERTEVKYDAFQRTIIVGDLNMERTIAEGYSFSFTKITGDMNIKRTVGFRYCFNQITVYGEQSIDEASKFLDTDRHVITRREFAADKSLSDGFIGAHQYEKFAIYCDLTLNDMIVEDNAFDDAIILGDIYFNGTVAYDKAFNHAMVLGDFFADEHTFLEWDMQDSENYAGKTFEEDVLITEAAVTTGQYKGATFMGNLTVESEFIGRQAFESTIILGELNIRSKIVGNEAFKSAVVAGEMEISAPTKIICQSAFSGLLPSSTSLSLPTSLTDIAPEAFLNVAFTEIGIKGCINLKWLGDRAFYGSQWKELIFPATVNRMTIGDNAFQTPIDKEYITKYDYKRRNVFLPHHNNNRLIYGFYPYTDYDIFTVRYADFMTPNDDIYLWLNPDDIEGSFPLTYGNWHLFVNSHLGVCGSNGCLGSYTLEPSDATYGSGHLYVPKGCKEKLIQFCKRNIVFISEFICVDYEVGGGESVMFCPFFLYFRDDHIIEIDMGEYPNYTIPEKDGIDDITDVKESVEVARYDISGKLLNSPSAGINIVRYNDGTVKKEFVN